MPLLTKRGIPIGSLFIVDSHIRPDLSPNDLHFMGTMAGTIMRHLEMAREVEEHRRGMKMSRGLASFVEGRSELVDADAEEDATEGTKVAGRFETETENPRSNSKSSSMRGSTQSTQPSVNSSERKEQEEEYSSALVKTEEAILASYVQPNSQPSRTGTVEDSHADSFIGTTVSQDDSPSQDTPSQGVPEVDSAEEFSEASSVKVLFSRASNLIREAFEVDGGVVFYDAQRGFGDPQLQQKPTLGGHTPHEDSHTSGDDLPSSGENEDQVDGPSSQEVSPGRSEGQSSPGLGEGMFTRSTRLSAQSEKMVGILGFSTADASSIHGNKYPGPQSFVPLEEKALHKLVRRYPRGKLWNFDGDVAVSSSSEEEALHLPQKDLDQATKDLHKNKVKSVRTKSDAKFLSVHFPGLRQLLFVPLWDAGRSRWLSGCFIWYAFPPYKPRQVLVLVLVAVSRAACQL